jgi:hypothetical protein
MVVHGPGRAAISHACKGLSDDIPCPLRMHLSSTSIVVALHHLRSCALLWLQMPLTATAVDHPSDRSYIPLRSLWKINHFAIAHHYRRHYQYTRSQLPATTMVHDHDSDSSGADLHSRVLTTTSTVPYHSYHDPVATPLWLTLLAIKRAYSRDHTCTVP